MISKPSDIHGDMARKLNAIEHQIGFNDTCLTSKLDLQKLIHHYLIATSFLQKSRLHPTLAQCVLCLCSHKYSDVIFIELSYGASVRSKPQLPEDSNLTRQILPELLCGEELSNCLIISDIGDTAGSQRLGRLQELRWESKPWSQSRKNQAVFVASFRKQAIIPCGS